MTARLNITVDVHGNAVSKIAGLNSSLVALGITTGKGQAQFQLASTVLSQFGVNIGQMSGLAATADEATAGMAGGIASLINPVTLAVAAVAALTVGLGVVAVKVAQFGAKLAVAAAPAAAMRASFDQLALSGSKYVTDLSDVIRAQQMVSANSQGLASVIGDELLKALQDASGGMVSMTSLMRQYNEASSLISPQWANDLVDIMPAIQKQALATGNTVEGMLDKFILGVARRSRLRLDDLGIIIDQTAASNLYAASIGKTTKMLSEQEKTIAFGQEAQRQLLENTKNLPNAAFSAAAGLQRLQASIADLGVKIGLSLQPALESLLPTAEAVINSMIELWDAHGDSIVKSLDIAVVEIKKLMVSIAALVLAVKTDLDRLASFFENGKDALTAFGEAWAEVGGGIMGTIQGLIAAIEELVGIDLSGLSSLGGGATIPGFQQGVRNFRGGLAVVGEGGPELVNLPPGSDVFSNRDSEKMAGGAKFYGPVTFNVPNGATLRSLSREIQKQVATS